MGLLDMADNYIRRQREAGGERLVWLKPGEVVVPASGRAAADTHTEALRGREYSVLHPDGYRVSGFFDEGKARAHAATTGGRIEWRMGWRLLAAAAGEEGGE